MTPTQSLNRRDRTWPVLEHPEIRAPFDLTNAVAVEKQSLILSHSRTGRPARHVLNSSNETSPIVPLLNLCAAICSPSAANRFGTAINE